MASDSSTTDTAGHSDTHATESGLVIASLMKFLLNAQAVSSLQEVIVFEHTLHLSPEVHRHEFYPYCTPSAQEVASLHVSVTASNARPGKV